MSKWLRLAMDCEAGYVTLEDAGRPGIAFAVQEIDAQDSRRQILASFKAGAAHSVLKIEVGKALETE